MLTCQQVPTTRSGSCVTSSSTVERDPFYDGRVQVGPVRVRVTGIGLHGDVKRRRIFLCSGGILFHVEWC